MKGSPTALVSPGALAFTAGMNPGIGRASRTGDKQAGGSAGISYGCPEATWPAQPAHLCPGEAQVERLSPWELNPVRVCVAGEDSEGV